MSPTALLGEGDGMKTRALSLILLVALSASCVAGTTITYTYDAQHRLVQASYSASEKEFFNHDAAGNVDQRVAITDAKYLESWLLYFSMLGPTRRPARGKRRLPPSSRVATQEGRGH